MRYRLVHLASGLALADGEYSYSFGPAALRRMSSLPERDGLVLSRGGLESYLQVLDAQRTLFQGELTLARLHQQELAAIIQLYRALGGGWS